jgi:hypothetical protein
MEGSAEYLGRVGDLVQRTGDGQAQVGYSVAERSGGLVTPCVVYIVHMETKSTRFLVDPQKQDRRFVSGLTSKPLGRFESSLTSKSLRWFLPVWPPN